MVASAVSSRRSAAGFSTRPRGVGDQRIIPIERSIQFGAQPLVKHMRQVASSRSYGMSAARRKSLKGFNASGRTKNIVPPKKSSLNL
jgi:hypothetical protein